MKISIITVNYNNAQALEKTMQSVISQQCTDYDYIVIDGGSTDGSVEVIQKYVSHLSYWVSEKDSGVYNAMNKAIQVARGDFCVFMNSGDTFYNTSVLNDIQPFLTTDFVCGNACLTYGNSVSTSFWTAPESIDKLFFVQRFSICHQSLFIRTSLLKERGYDDSLKIVADYEQVFYEMVVNRRTYQKADMTICYYGCDGISSDPKKADAEKCEVIDRFRANGYIEADELQDLVKTLKIGTRKYKIALFFIKFVVDGSLTIRKWIKK